MSSSTQVKRIENPMLLWLFKALGWLILGMSALVVFVNIPIFYQYIIETSRFPYLPSEIIAIFRSVIRRFGELIYFGLAILILWRSRDAKALLLACFAPALGAAIGGSYVEVAPFVESWLLAIVLLVAALSSSLGVLLLYVLPDGNFFPKQGRVLVFVLMLLECLRVYLATLSYGNLFSFGLILPLFLIGGMGIWAQARRYRDASSVYRQQFKWIIFGGGAVFIGIAITVLGGLLLPIEYRVFSAGMDEVGGIVLAISLLFASLRYRLYDIDLFINRSLVYGAVFIGLAALFTALLFLTQTLLQSLLPDSNSSPLIIALLLLVALLFNPIRRQIQHWIDRHIYHFRFDLNQLEQVPPAPAMAHGFIGQGIAGYQIMEQIGRGGMGDVYRAVKDGRTVAIKILNLVHALDSVARRRFEREAELTERFKHPNIIHFHGRGEVDGLSYLAVEYIDGISLDKFIEENEALSLESSKSILRDIGAALQFAHERGLVHRDIKPSNIMLRRQVNNTYQAILMDLGLAKVIGESATVTGLDAIGTIAYMSPEQIQEGRAVDKRSDIYSMAVMAYQMLTGQLPFSGSAGRILFGHINQPAPDPQALKPDLPPTISLAIQRAMAKSPDDRYPDVAAFIAALD